MEFFETSFEKTLNEMNIPLISIIVPVYNTAPWLAKCLDSICAQDYRNLEILCIDDGSTDNSAEILKEYAAKDTRIKVYTQKNAGLSASRNTGLEHASGEWVTGVDSDDYLYPGIYNQLLDYCYDEVDVVFFGVQVVSEDMQELPARDYFNLPEAGEYEMTPHLASILNVCFWSKLWRRSLIERYNFRFPVGLVHEDEALYWSFMPCVKRIAVCRAIGYAYMQRCGSIMNADGLNVVNRKQRLMPVLEFVHAEYKKRGLLKTKAKDYLIRMFIEKCCNIPNQDYETIHNHVTEVIKKCNMKHAHYRLERLFPTERRGLLTIYRYERKKIYKFMGVPIWITYYTQNCNAITPSLILKHIIRRFMRRFAL